MLRLALIGDGRIARSLLSALADRPVEVVARLTRTPGRPGTTTEIADVTAARPDLVIEVAGPAALSRHGARLLGLAEVWTVSAAALAEPDVAAALSEAERTHAGASSCCRAPSAGSTRSRAWRAPARDGSGHGVEAWPPRGTGSARAGARGCGARSSKRAQRRGGGGSRRARHRRDRRRPDRPRCGRPASHRPVDRGPDRPLRGGLRHRPVVGRAASPRGRVDRRRPRPADHSAAAAVMSASCRARLRASSCSACSRCRFHMEA